MPILLSAHQLAKSFAARPLFEGLTFSISDGERIGLIGPNGAGKSTLLRILAGRESPDQGTLSLSRGLKIGFLEQVPSFGAAQTVEQAVLQGVLLGAPQGDARASARGHESAHAETDWREMDRVHELLSRLDLDPGARLETLSGGWKKRVALARELARTPDLLLLDEPTNHLDVESILWLEDFLSRAPFSTVTITHDRLFLQKVSNRILELDPRNAGGILSVSGDYAAYLETKEQLIAAQERREVILKNTLRRETEWLRRGAKARTTKQQARIDRAGALAGEVSELSARNQVRRAGLEFASSERNPRKLLEAKGIAKAYGERRLFDGLDLLLGPGARVGLLGGNGCGKSTLIRVLLGQEPVDAGSVARSEHLKPAYFEQNRETLDPSLSVLKTVCPTGDHVHYRGSQVHVKSYLDRFHFTYGQMEMAVGKLSGGEQSRLLLARLMLQEANLLVLDEPTNDLDLATLNVLEECLAEFDGAVLLVTHDRYFLDQVADRILAFDGGGITAFEGLSQWEEWRARREREEKAARQARESKARATVGGGSGDAKEAAAARTPARRKLSYKDQRELDQMEATIQRAEERLAELTAASQDPENLKRPSRLAEIGREMNEAQLEIDRLFSRWAELEGS